MKISMFISSLLLCWSLNAQLTVIDSFTVEGTVDIAQIGPDFTVTNDGADDSEFYWKLVRERSMPLDWAFQICDKLTCYLDFRELGPCDMPNLLTSGESYDFYKVGLQHNGVPGRHSATFYLTTECDSISEDYVLSATVITFDVTGDGTATVEINDKANYGIYPNPASETISIDNDEQIAGLTFYNHLGKTIKAATHSQGESHDVSDLDQGMFIIELRDKNKTLLGAQRFYKVD